MDERFSSDVQESKNKNKTKKNKHRLHMISFEFSSAGSVDPLAEDGKTLPNRATQGSSLQRSAGGESTKTCGIRV